MHSNEMTATAVDRYADTRRRIADYRARQHDPARCPICASGGRS